LKKGLSLQLGLKGKETDYLLLFVHSLGLADEKKCERYYKNLTEDYKNRMKSMVEDWTTTSGVRLNVTPKQQKLIAKYTAQKPIEDGE
jgi:hypothetical protein